MAQNDKQNGEKMNNRYHGLALALWVIAGGAVVQFSTPAVVVAIVFAGLAIWLDSLPVDDSDKKGRT